MCIRDRFDQRAIVKDAHTVELADGTTKSAKHILIATGGHPVRPDLENANLGIVSDDIFDLPELPKTILIIGGGYIACEFAGVFNGLGVETTQYYRGAQILRGFDEEARGLIAEEMKTNGVDLHCGTDIIEMSEAEGGIRVKATNGTERVFDKVLFATGRVPNTKGMGLEDADVNLGRKGEILSLIHI